MSKEIGVDTAALRVKAYDSFKAVQLESLSQVYLIFLRAKKSLIGIFRVSTVSPIQVIAPDHDELEWNRNIHKEISMISYTICCENTVTLKEEQLTIYGSLRRAHGEGGI